MPKKKPASKKAKDIKDLAKYGAAALLVLISISLALYLPPTLKQRHLENKFMLLNTDVDSLKAELGAKFPDKTFEKDKYCANYPGELFKGSRYCSIVVNTVDPLSVNDSKKTSQIINQNIKWKTESSANINSFPYHVGEYTHKPTGIKCSLSFSNYVKSSKNNQALTLSFDCRALSGKNFFPYKSS